MEHNSKRTAHFHPISAGQHDLAQKLLAKMSELNDKLGANMAQLEAVRQAADGFVCFVFGFLVDEHQQFNQKMIFVEDVSRWFLFVNLFFFFKMFFVVCFVLFACLFVKHHSSCFFIFIVKVC